MQMLALNSITFLSSVVLGGGRLCCTYRVDDPRGSVPSRSIDGRPEVEEKYGSNAATLQVVGWVVGRVDNVNVGTNDPHANRASDSTDEQQLSSAQLIHQEQQPDKCHDGLYDTKETSQEVDGIGLNTKTLLK